MSIRGLIFLLVLYIALAWVIVAYLYQQDGARVIMQWGLLWTAIGLGALLLWLLGQQVVGWWRLRRARAKTKPAQPEPAAKRVHEDDAAFSAFLAEADGKLARSQDGSNRRLRDYPIYLLVGPDGAGKTSLLHNAGVDARLLAGQVAGSGSPVTGTRLANIWLANECVFVEVGGRLFQGEAARFGEFLSVLRPSNRATGWRGLWNPSFETLQLRGVILCWDLRGFVAVHDRMSLERSSHAIREKLLKIAEVFGVRCPVYAMFTKADAIPFFAEFFGRLPESEAGQPLGVLSDFAGERGRIDEGVWAEAETRKLSRDFNRVFACLNSRRLLALSHEPLADRKAAIYEFPREFKRLRPSVVQFLVDALRPDPLSLSPILRGFFFCGTQQVEAAPGAPMETTHASSVRNSAETTQIFRPDATQILSGRAEVQNRGNLVDKPAFTRDFFQVVLRNDRPPIPVEVASDSKLARQRSIAVGVATALACLLILTWAVSWSGNRALVKEVETNVAASGRRIQDMSLESLVALDSLRHLLAERLDKPRPLSMNWGLYAGDRLREGVWNAYFGRLRQILLNDVNAHLIVDLRTLDPATHPVLYDTAYQRLKTHITIAQSGCPVDVPMVGATLRQAASELHRDLGDQRKDLVNRQIDYYVASLAHVNPVRLAADSEAAAHARAYLSNSRGPQQMYAAILADVRKDATRILVRERVSNYRAAMTAPEEVVFEFTKDGREKFEKLADSGKFNLTGEACVLGAANQVGEKVASIEQIRQVKSIYYGRYKEEWGKFLAQTNVLGYRDIPDAVSKLDILSGSASPLLGLVKFAAENTYFPVLKPAADDGLMDKALSKVGLGGAKKQAEKVAEKIESTRTPEFSSVDLNRVFQPAHVAVPPDGKNLVTDKNKGYVDGLRKLLESLDKYKNASATERLPLIAQVQEAFAQANGAQRGLADSFNQDTEGVDRRVAEIFLQPIRNARALIPTNTESASAGERNTKLAQMCQAVGPILLKYPFNRRSDAVDLSLTDLSRAFAPGSGLIWKYQAQAMNDLLVKNGSRWEQKPDMPKPQVTTELLEFLNRAQAVSDGFFQGGAQQPQLQYSLRPLAGQATKLKLEIDGRTLNSKESSFQKDFIWPGPSGAEGAIGNVLTGENEYHGFGLYAGTWGVFRLFQYADERALGERFVIWSNASGINAPPQPMTPVKVEIMKFPAGGDVLNPRFIAPLKCPRQAVAP